MPPPLTDHVQLDDSAMAHHRPEQVTCRIAPNTRDEQLPVQHAPPPPSPGSFAPITLTFVDVTYAVKIPPRNGTTGGISSRLRCKRDSTTSDQVVDRTILTSVTAAAYPGEILAILGPSGSGKSTLLSILGGRLPTPTTSSVLLNGRALPPRVLRRRAGFVSQDDVLYPHLTVRETLLFAALLRLPDTLPRARRLSKAEALVSELGLAKCADTQVGGSWGVRGVSGGERRRVSIGLELLADPGLLLLDEPTSGLDSTAAHRVVATLQGVARKGSRAVVAAVHQPPSRVFQMFDAVLLLSSEGRCLYFGKAKDAMDYFSSIGLRPRFPANPADFMLDLANGVAQLEGERNMEKSKVKQDMTIAYEKFIAPTIKATIDNKSISEKQHSGPRCANDVWKNHNGVSWLNQFSILLHRSLKERRHESFSSLRVFQVVASAVLAGAIWWQSDVHDVQDRLGLLFFMSIFLGVLPSISAVFAFPQERPIYVKEMSSGMYGPSAYYMARTVGDLPMELILPTIFTTITYWMAGLKPEPWAFMLTVIVLLGYVLVAQGLGLFFGAVIKDAKKASTLATITMLAFLLTGGFYVQKIPICLAWMKYLSFNFYCYQLLIRVQYSGREMVIFLNSAQQKAQSGNGRNSIGNQEEVSTIVSIAALIGMFLGYRLLAYAALRRIKV